MMTARFCTAALVATTIGCSAPQKPPPRAGSSADEHAGPMPSWMGGLAVESNELCGFGVAGAGYNEHSPYPKRLSEERAVKNLAGVLGTRVQEAIIDRQLGENLSVQTARAITVDEALIQKVSDIAKTEFWLDRGGRGPYAKKGFMYAHACIEAKVAADTFAIDAAAFQGGQEHASAVRPEAVPGWIEAYGKQAGGRLCAVGFTLPMFHPDKTFQAVVEDIRGQLAKVIQTFVSSYYEELTTARTQAMESMTLATTEAVSEGAVVTHYWYDRDGIGPFSRQRSTYGWGCVYPVDVLASSSAAVEEQLPEDEKGIIARVRQRARVAFDDLDAEIEKRESQTVTDTGERSD